MAVMEAVAALPESTLAVLRRAGNPFRNYFARNPDDEICGRFHVADLFAREREQLLSVVDLYRQDPGTHSEVVPILGNKGAGKTHLLHSIKHGQEGAWQMLVTPGVFQKDAEFLEYLLFQVIDTLLGGGKQKGSRPLEFVGEELTRGLLHKCLTNLTREEQMELFPAPGLGKWVRRFGLGGAQAEERSQWLADHLAHLQGQRVPPGTLRRLCSDCNLTPDRACAVLCKYIDKTEARNTAGLMRRQIHQGFAKAALLGEETELACFLTYGFAELDFQVRPSRQDLVLALFKVLMEVFLDLKIPVVVAFDQLEDLLLARRADDGHRIAEAFFAGIIQAMHQIDGICFLIFAERGLWNRFVPSLDGYIQDRLSNPIHLPGHGTFKTLRLEAPPPDLVRRVVEARLKPSLAELPDHGSLPTIYPITEEQIQRIAKTEPTLRDMLQQFRLLFDHLVSGEPGSPLPEEPTVTSLPPGVKSMVVVETPAATPPSTPRANFGELWDQEMRSAIKKLEPEGALTGATRELQNGLGAFLKCCHDHGVKVGPWRLQHVVGELAFGEHPTYGVVTIGHWVCKDGQPWKVGIGLFLGRGPGKPKDLETKLACLDQTPAVVDHLILLRPEDDLALTGKSKTLWNDALKEGRHARLEATNLDAFASLYCFPRFISAVSETLAEGQPLPNLADLIQDRCEKLLEQIACQCR